MPVTPCLRRAGPADLDAILAIKRALPMPRNARTRSGGFLLGADPIGYAHLLDVGRAWLLDCDGAPVGFALTLSDATLRASALWARRELIRWQPDVDPTAWLDGPIGWFDQLAVLPRPHLRHWGAALGLYALSDLLDSGHQMILTTTVVEPVANFAALPLLARVGARAVGQLEEHYSEVGDIVSAIHAIEATDCRRRLELTRANPPPALARVLELGLQPRP